jgi:hypothetical protein
LRAFDLGAVAGKTRGVIDNVDYVDGTPGLVTHPRPTVVPHGAPLLVSGWTVDPATGEAPQAVCILLDGGRALKPQTGIPRTALMQTDDTPEFVGYGLVLPTRDLQTGPHELRTYALGADGSWYESASVGFRLFDHHRALSEDEALMQELRMFLDIPLNASTGLAIPTGTPVRANHWVLFRGYTFDQAIGRGAETIVASDEEGRTWSGPANIEDEAARAALTAPDARVGFEVAIPAAIFGRGRHNLRFTGLDAAGRRYANFIEGTFDVIGAERPFPLTARVASFMPPFAAHVRVVGDALDVDDLGPTRLRAVLPADAPIVLAPRARLVIEGWALDESGNAADEVYLELTATWVDLPPRRFPAQSARGTSVEDISEAPVDNAWFRCTFDTPADPNAVYELALVVVQPGRCSYSRASVAMLQINV